MNDRQRFHIIRSCRPLSIAARPSRHWRALLDLIRERPPRSAFPA